MSGTSGGASRPGPSRRRVSPNDVLAFVVIAAAVAGPAAAWRLARTHPEPSSFPKHPSEFQSAASLAQEEIDMRAVLEENPQDLDALSRLTLVFYQQGPEKAHECIEYGDRALSLGALDERLFYCTAVCYETKGVVNHAAYAFEKYLRHQPEDLETRLRLGNLYFRMDELEKAEQAFRDVLARRPGDPLVSFNLAVALRDRQEWRGGLDVLEPVLERDKTLPAGGFRVLGDLRRGAKDLDGALGAYRREIERSPEDPELLAAAALVHEESGRPDDALATWKRVLDLDPKNKQASSKIRTLSRKKR